MRCPNRACRSVTTRLVTIFDKDGKQRRGCPKCVHRIGRKRERVRTNRKIWPGYEVYGANKTIELNHLWIENMARKAAHMRRTAHHSRFV